MKTNFEIWVSESINASQAVSVLNEAVICYKVSAYRASLLLSYLAFIDIIKRRILEAKKPSTIKEGEWAHKKKILLDEDAAEKEVYEMINNSESKYFRLNDSIRTQVKYWKDRRNDCAHIKTNIINESHVESFWSFLMSNLNKFTVVDSGTDLLSRIKRHYDYTYTPVDADVTPLILKIPCSVELSDFQNFLQEVNIELGRVMEENWFYDDGRANVFFLMLTRLSFEYAELTKKYILDNETLKKELFEYHPEFLSYISSEHPETVRQLWMEHLKEVNTSYVACILLRNSVIPAEQIDEFIRECVYRMHDIKPRDEDIKFLSAYNFQAVIDNSVGNAIEHSSIGWWVNENRKFIKYYIQYCFVNKYSSLIDLFMVKYKNKASGETVERLYTIFSEVIGQKPEFLEYAKERAEINDFDLDMFLLFY